MKNKQTNKRNKAEKNTKHYRLIHVVNDRPGQAEALSQRTTSQPATSQPAQSQTTPSQPVSSQPAPFQHVPSQPALTWVPAKQRIRGKTVAAREDNR